MLPRNEELHVMWPAKRLEERRLLSEHTAADTEATLSG